MEFAFSPPTYAYAIIAVIVVVAALAIFLKKMAGVTRIISLVLVVVAGGALAFFLLRTTHIVVDAQGIRTDTYGRQSLPWDSVKEAVVVSDLSASAYALRVRTGGTSLGDFRAGWFRLADGRKAFVTTELRDRALVIETDGMTWVFGPRDFDAFVAQVRRYVPVTGAGGGQT
jgi:hypothetical protein